MKKRILALTLTIAMVLTLSVVALAGPDADGKDKDLNVKVTLKEKSKYDGDLFKINKDAFAPAKTTVYATATVLYRPLGTSNWATLTSAEETMDLPVLPWAQTWEVQMVSGTATSQKPTNVKVAAQAAAPAAKVSPAKGTIAVKPGWEIGFEGDISSPTSVWTVDTDVKALNVGTGSSLEVKDGDTKITKDNYTLGNEAVIFVRVPSKDLTKKPDSGWAMIDLSVYHNKVITEPDANSFYLNGTKVVAVGGAKYEAYDKAANKWTTVKSAADFDKEIRRAGTKSYWPSGAVKLTAPTGLATWDPEDNEGRDVQLAVTVDITTTGATGTAPLGTHYYVNIDLSNGTFATGAANSLFVVKKDSTSITVSSATVTGNTAKLLLEAPINAETGFTLEIDADAFASGTVVIDDDVTAISSVS